MALFKPHLPRFVLEVYGSEKTVDVATEPAERLEEQAERLDLLCLKIICKNEVLCI